MKKSFFTVIIFLLAISAAVAQTAILHVAFTNATTKNYRVWMPGHSALQQQDYNVLLDSAHSGSYTVKLAKPEFALLMYSNNDADTAKTYEYILYLSPGDNINFTANFRGKYNGAKVTGRGSKNNQPLLSALAGARVDSLYGDTTPTRIIAFANKHQAGIKAALSKYITLYKPSPDFIANEKFNIIYDAAYQYYDFKEENKFRIWKSYDQNLTKWSRLQDSLFATIKLNNDEALTAINYIQLVKDFLLREKERLWTYAAKNPKQFFKDWYNSDVETGRKLFTQDEQNLLQEKIINRYFTNHTAEFLYSCLFDNAMDEHNPDNIVLVFNDFKKQYPNSKYIGLYQPFIDSVKAKETRLTADMVILKDNGTTLNTFDDLLALVKGKTVLLDMWGTWCGPCRNEISENGPAIKAYFKGKGLDYFYVANRDLQHEDEWKKLIGYFDMKGTHILANASLTKDIMTKAKGTGYPTYIIIKKDGTYELSKAGYPMDRQVLIKQLEDALKN